MIVDSAAGRPQPKWGESRLCLAGNRDDAWEGTAPAEPR